MTHGKKYNLRSTGARNQKEKPRVASRVSKFLACRHVIFTLPTFLLLVFISWILLAKQQQEQSSVTLPIVLGPPTSGAIDATTDPAAVRVSAVPPPRQRPDVRVNVREFARRTSDDIRLVSNRTSCASRIGRFYEQEGDFQQLDAARIRDSILNQINSLLSQHKAAVSGIVSAAEEAAAAHQFIKNLRVNYTDVHRTRNELEPLPAASGAQVDPLNDYTTNQYGGLAGGGGTSGDRPSFTSISGGTPVPGPPEWQTPIKSIVMQMNRNFGDIPVNISMSAIHLPLPIYPGLPEIMNGIAWTERLDATFRRNLVQFMHVHHQYYGDTLGFLRTFPAHKWRIPRNEPDLFDARTRPWYIAGAATPKDVVIIVDTSGSMTGLRREIARGVVFEILDTLTISDNFAVLRFSETVTPVGLPACQLRKPRLVPQLEELCAASMGISMGGSLAPMSAPAPGLSSQARAFADTVGALVTGGNSGNSPLGGQQQAGQAAASSGAQFLASSFGSQPVSQATMSSEQRRELAFECANWRRQLEARKNYPRDHPSVELGKNGTAYLSDDAYRQSIVNVSLDIRDAFLLPATSRNIRYLKSNFSMPTAGIANFTRALMAGFELLQSYNRSADLGAQCNQAIMLITDGAIKAHPDVFNRYNYPGAPVRVFTYMIGREVGDIRPTKEMACKNRGYYTHVINLGEVREQVQKYLPVMARPLVLEKKHPIVWTNAYGDETYQVLTDWVLEMKRRERSRIMLNEERERLNEANSSDVINLELTGLAEYDELPQVDETLKNRIICEDAREDPEAMDASLGDEIDPLGYNDLACHWSARRADLLMSVVKPVFDKRNSSIFFERYLSKNIWQEKEIHLRNAQLLGVAAVDLRIDDIVRAAPSHLLGPNGYSILLGQNGFVMHHPDFTALLEDPFDKQSKILKPHFSAVDLTHIEQVYHRSGSGGGGSSSSDGGEQANSERRREDERLIKLREAAVKRTSGYETITLKRSFDCRKRPHVRKQSFYYGPIKDTPYSFMLALPQSYGFNRVEAKLALDKHSYNLLKPSDYDLWTLHPNYRYCELNSARNHLQQLHLNDSLNTLIRLLNMTSQGELYEFEYDDLSAISGSSNPEHGGGGGGSSKQGNSALASKRQFMAGGGSGAQAASQVPKFTCDKELFPSLLFDAKATYESFVSTSSGQTSTRGHSDEDDCSQAAEDMRTKLAQIYGLEMSFVATRSGLTRARIFDNSTRIRKLASLFIERHDRAIDESWYARTVDWNMRFGEDSTIISVSYNAYVRLIAKLRQRITQRHPALNDTRANCDPSLVEDTAGGATGDQQQQQQAPPGGSESNAGGESNEAGTAAPESVPAPESPAPEQAQNDEPRPGDSAAASASLQQETDTPREQSKPSNDGPVAQVNSLSPDDGYQLLPAAPKINYSEYSSFDFLDLLANSSVHVTATQAIIANKSKRPQRTPVGVTGHLYDYAIFARKFLNSTSLDIRTYPVAGSDQDLGSAAAAASSGTSSNVKVDICPGGECPTKCGFRNDTIDCLLVDNNGFIVVGEELAHIGRSLVDYDENLMRSLVDKRVFYKIQLIDYQAICARNDQMTSDQQRVAAAAASGAMGSVPGGNITAMLLATPSASSASSPGPASGSSLQLGVKLELAQRLLANLAGALIWIASQLYSALLLRSSVPEPDDLFGRESLIGRLHQWQRSALLADAQSLTANQSLLALLPNKTYLRPCETTVTLYETRPPSADSSKLFGSDAPEFYETKCGCSGWYVYDAVPKTNLLVLIVNTTSACRRCEQAPSTMTQNDGNPPALQTPLVDLATGVRVTQTSVTGGLSVPLEQGGKSASSSAPDKTNQGGGGGGGPSPEEQVCAMLERDQPLYVRKDGSCLTQHPDEAHIHICGGANKLSPTGHLHSLLVLALSVIATIWSFRPSLEMI